MVTRTMEEEEERCLAKTLLPRQHCPLVSLALTVDTNIQKESDLEGEALS